MTPQSGWLEVAARPARTAQLTGRRAGSCSARLAAQGDRLLAPYSEEQLRLLIDFHRLGIEVQERHADFLRERLRSGARKPA